MKQDIAFGTDGWRAVVGEGFTFANLDRVAQATARLWRRHPPAGTTRSVVVGYDRRFLSDQFAERTASIMAAHGFDVWLTSRPTPTPAISQAVKAHRAAGGVMITASHNPARFNGFKLKAHFGGSAEPSLCQAVEREVDRAAPREPTAAQLHRIRRVDLRPAHYRAIKKRVDFDAIARSRLRFAHDPLFGVGAGCFDELLAGTTCRVTTLNAVHDPNFGGINPEPVLANYGPTSAYLKRHPHDLCLVTDGDADRVGGMDGRGGYLSTHQIICLLLYHMKRHRHGQGRVVKALTTTTMVDRMCEDYGLALVETGVGFKYIAAEMLKGGVLLGAEESGGIGFQGHIPERDGLLAGLMLLELLAKEGRSVRQLTAHLARRYGPHHYDRIDMPYPLEKRADLMKYCVEHPPSRLGRSPVEEVKTYDGVKFVARNGSWLMLRGSGTEPILRVYAEASSPEEARRLLKLGVQWTRQA